MGESGLSKTVSAVVAYDDPSGATYMLVFNQAILVKRMRNILLSTFQVRTNGVYVNDLPKCLADEPTIDHHTISVRLPTLAIEDNDEHWLRIPLSLKGVTSYFPVRKPTKEEWELCPLANVIEVTAELPEWDPSDTYWERAEENITGQPQRLYEPATTRRSYVSAMHTEQEPDDLSSALLDTVTVTSTETVRNSEASISSVQTGKRGSPISYHALGSRWGISVGKAKRVLEVTTQNGLRSVLHPTLSRRFRTNDRQLRYRRLSHTLYTDTAVMQKTPSWHRQNEYAQIFSADNGWCRVYPMRTKGDAHEGLSKLFQREGAPPLIVADGSKEQQLGNFARKCKECMVNLRSTEPHSPWQNAAEGAIRELKRGAGRKMAKTGSPAGLWDHCLELEAYIRSNTPNSSYELQGQVPETLVSGQTSDISPFVEAGWYEFVFAWDQTAAFPSAKEELCRWLGPSLDTGPAMTSKLLRSNGQVIYRSTWRTLSREEYKDEVIIAKMKDYDAGIEAKIKAHDAKIKAAARNKVKIDPDLDIDPSETPNFQLYEDDFSGVPEHVPDIDAANPDVQDEYVGAEVNLTFGGEIMQAKVLKRARDDDGQLIGEANDRATLDTRKYLVEFSDGRMSTVAANALAESMMEMCDPDGNQYRQMDSVVDHRRNADAVEYDDRFITIRGRKHKRVTTKGWEICVQWVDGSTSWETLADMKESYPLEVAEYAVSRKIDGEAAFHWWVPYVISRRNRIIKAVNKRYLKRTHKFGIELPKTVEEALELDRKNGNTLWADAIAKEMKNVRVAFEIIPDDKTIKPGYQYCPTHMVFEVKLDGFKRKARLVAQGCAVKTPPMLTYSSVVGRETVRIALTYAALNDLDVKASDIQNAYLTAPCEEKVWATLGKEFGSDEGKKAYIVRALYGLNSSGASFTRHLADCMRHLGYKACVADGDLWMREAVRPDDGLRYYSYILLYVDDALAIGHDAEGMLKELDRYFMMKPGSIADPDVYLGAKARKVTLSNGVTAWSMCPSKYVQEAVSNVKTYLEETKSIYKVKKQVGPWPSNYSIELDDTDELDPKLANYYQSQVGVLLWCLEIGRVDIITEVSKLASCMALPRKGHFEAMLHVMGYLHNKHNSRMVFDPSYQEIDEKDFITCDWTGFYQPTKEEIPTNCPEPLGKDFDIVFSVDASHADDKLKRMSRSGYFAFLNGALILWKSKRQGTIETSAFGSEFVALKIAMEANRGLRFKLRMMGIPVNGPSFFYGDNMSVIHNVRRPESVLKKKSNSICYHAVREAVAKNELLVAHCRSEENVSDLATKTNHPPKLREYLVNKLLYHVYDPA